MEQKNKKQDFIVGFAYVLIWTAIIYVLMKYAMPLFMPFVAAFVISFLLKPIINFITEKTPLGRKLVAVLVLIVVYLGLGSLLALAGTKLVIQLGNWMAELPRLYSQYIEPSAASISDSFEKLFVSLDPAVVNFLNMASDNISNSVSSIVSSVSRGAINAVSGMAGKVPVFIVGFVLTIIASFFFVVDYYKIATFIVSQFSENGRRKLFLIKDYVVNVLFRFGRAYLLLMSLTFIEVSIGLTILRVENVFFIAFITAIVDVLPIFGTGTIMIPWALYSLFSGNYFLGVGLLILYGIITFVRQILEPKIVGHQIGLYPLLTLISMFIGARMFGFAGMFALPVIVTVIIHLNRNGEIKLFREVPKNDPT